MPFYNVNDANIYTHTLKECLDLPALSSEDYKKICDEFDVEYIEMVKIKPDGHKVTVILPIDKRKKDINITKSKFQKLIKLMS